VPVHQQILHPDWNGNRADGNDIALLKLERPLESAFRPIPLAGEGIDVLGGPLLEMLKYSGQGIERVPDVGIVPNEGCDQLRRGMQLTSVTEDMTCSYAFGLNNSAGLNGCLLVFMNVSNTAQSNEESPKPGSLLGIAPFDRSNRLRNRGLPIVFANVAYFSKWIRSEMANRSATEISARSLGADGMAKNSSAACSSHDIPGSQEASPGRFPYIVSMRNNVSRMHFCVGTLVAPLWVLMPAHCLDGNNTGQTPLAFVGAGNTTDESGKEQNTSRIVVHPTWDLATGSGADLAMAKLEKPVENVAIPMLANSPLVLPALLSVVGWPRDNSTSMLAGSLHYADLITVSKKECAEFYAEDTLGSMVCAGGVKPDVCEGYSGGPLLLVSAPNDTVIDGNPENDHVVGIVSFGAEPCTDAEMPIVFTNISEGDVRAWIDSRLNEPDGPTLSPDEQNRLDEELLLLARSEENSTTQSMVDGLLNKGADPNAVLNREGIKILHEAATTDNLIVAEAILAAGALVDDRTITTRNTALHVASNENSTRVAKALINAGATVSSLNQDGRTPLHFAAKAGHSLMTDLLLVGGADWALRIVADDETALHLSARRNAPIVPLLLIRAGADVNALNTEWQTPLHIAAENGQVEVATVLVMAGANQSAMDNYGDMPKDIICMNDFAPEMCTDEDRERLVELLIPPSKTEDDEEVGVQLHTENSHSCINRG